MADEEDKAQPKLLHQIGERLDALSIHEFDERIAMLQAEVARLEVAKRLKQAALDQAGSVFRR